jgi:hypothetical protein
MANEAQVRQYLDPEEPDYKAAAAALGVDALPVLESLVRSADPLLASKAAYLASLIPDPQATRVLEEAARSDHPTVRVAAAAGLQKRPEATEEVVAQLATDLDAGVRKVAARTARRGATPARPGGAGARVRSPQLTEDEHGGGFSPDTDDAGEKAEGEGGGDAGGARARYAETASAEESEAGGGGDLGGAGTAQVGAPSDGPDGGGAIGGDDATYESEHGESTHGGGA